MADTQAMSALVKALTGVLPDTAIRQIMQALGNCTQPATTRAPQNFQANEFQGNTNGVYGAGKWNPSQYPGLLPSAGSGGFYDIPGPGGWSGGNYIGGNTSTSNYDGNSFFFPTNQEFSLNNYYGGPTFNVGGNSTFNNIDATNINVQYLNNNYVGGGGGQDQQPQQPAIPGGGGGGTGAVPGGGGFVGVIPIGGPSMPVVGRQISLRASGNVTVPKGGTLTDDCKVVLNQFRRASVQIEISPLSFMALG